MSTTPISAPQWEATNLRLTVFAQNGAVLPSDLWKRFSGSDPESSEVRAREAIRKESGPFGPNARIMQSAVIGNRVDFVLNRLPALDNSGVIQDGLGPWPEVAEKFQGNARQFLKEWSVPTIRLAFGAQVMAETPSREESYAVLARMVRSLTIDPAGMRDLIFRVNWPLPSKASPQLVLNRITTIASLAVNMGVMTGGMPPLATMSTVAMRHYATLELDLSSIAESTEPLSNLPEMFDELAALAYENVEKGEVRS
jgi:hypothetical protein